MPGLSDYLILCLAAAAGGVVNSVAGGGTLLTFPSLFVALGSSAEAAVMANATSTVALFPGAVASLAGYRRELQQAQRWAWLLLAPSLLGGLLGALLVTELPASLFEAMVPWLILTAAVLFWLQPHMARWIGIARPKTVAPPPAGDTESLQPPAARAAAGVIAFQFLVAVYGGYFGAGIGILMLSALAMMGLSDIHVMNSLKVLFNICINGVAVMVFIAGGKVHWPLALAMAAAAMVGGYLGAAVARQLERNLVRRVVVAIGFALAAWYFYRQFSG